MKNLTLRITPEKLIVNGVPEHENSFYTITAYIAGTTEQTGERLDFPNYEEVLHAMKSLRHPPNEAARWRWHLESDSDFVVPSNEVEWVNLKRFVTGE